MVKPTPKPLAKPLPPKAFSLNILNNKTKEINKNKEELKAFLGEIMANKKPPLRQDSAGQASISKPIPVATKNPEKEIPQDVLESLLRVKTED
jgi:hypothetical protein